MWDTKSDADDFYLLLSELQRTKVYKAAYGETPFPDTDPNLRRLPLNPQATGEQAPVWFEFRRTGKRVIVLAADSSATLDLLEKQVERIFSAIPE